jgi:biotin carboxyl carrier protein
MPNYFVMTGEDEEAYAVETLDDGRYRIEKPSGDVVIVDAFAPQPGRLHVLTEDGASGDYAVRENDGDYSVVIRGIDTHVEVLNERQRRMRAAGVNGRGATGPDLVSPMAGKVVAIPASIGDVVEEGEVVVIVEAMKMENDLKAHTSGTVTGISVEEGQAVEVGDVLVSIETPAE